MPPKCDYRYPDDRDPDNKDPDNRDPVAIITNSSACSPRAITMAFVVGATVPLGGRRPVALTRVRAPYVTARRGRAVLMCAAAPAGLEAAWTSFAARMADTGEAPAVAEWDKLFREARDAGEDPAKAIWVLDRMQQAGARPTAGTYELLLEICIQKDDRAAAFLLVEKMWADKVLLGDVTLPEDMEKTLRAILPPEAFD